ncbi:MAG TPA: hypothetical protein PKL15_14725 [Saprospiraceae bacterium]|nr:hypothetical protein [Saprospiraceae bacterium]HNM26691.1 hypothetical protein [Saprospiraceae bacterium]
MQRAVFITLLFCAFFGQISGQSTAYVFKGGLSLGSQKWDNSERQLLFAWHAALSIESVDNEDDRASLFAQIGYHVRGSATRFRFVNLNGFPGSAYSEGFRFNNISLVLGAKQKFPVGADGQNRLYYFGGIRGDYTLSTNIDELGEGNSCAVGVYPFIGGVQRWIGGVSAGGGFEFKLGELVGGELQLAVHPDFTLQYRQPPGNITLPGDCTLSGQPMPISLPERKIRNTTVELSLGIRLLKKVVYED